MAYDSPIGYTTRYSLKKFAEGAYPGADQLNQNWDLIDTAIYTASLANSLIYTLPIRRSGNTISFAYNTAIFKVESNRFDLKYGGYYPNIKQDGTEGYSGINTVQDIHELATPYFEGINITSSSKFGSSLAQSLHQFTGSMEITGSDQYAFQVVGGSAMANFSSVVPTLTLSGGSPMNGVLNIAPLNSSIGILISNTISDGISLKIKRDNASEADQILLQNESNTNLFKINYKGDITQYNSSSYSNDFTSGWAGSGFRLDKDISAPGSTLELDSLWVRGTMNVYELVINTIRATNGSFFVSSTAKVKRYQYGGATPPAVAIIEFEDPEGHGVCPFTVDDILISQVIDLDSTTVVKRNIVSVVSVTGSVAEIYPDYVTGNISEGDVFCRIGNKTNATRRSSIYMSSDDNGAPFIDVIDGVEQYANWLNSSKLKLRLGKLSGITNDNFGTLQGYGLYAKGGIYLESSGSDNSIAMKVDNDSAQLTMKKGNATIFDFNTETDTAKISGWSIDDKQLWANNLTSPSTMSLYASGDDAYMYVGNGMKSSGLIIGRIPSISGYESNEGDIGIFGYDTLLSRKFFVLTNDERSIAGWNFDQHKLYKGTANAGIVFSSDTSIYLNSTGSGFEVFNPSNPKMIIGKRNGPRLDWNITTPNALTISGSIYGSYISGSIIQATTITGSQIFAGFVSSSTIYASNFIAGEISASIITSPYIRTAISGKRLEINSGSLNNIKWTTATNKTFSMTPEDQGSLPGLYMGAAYFQFENTTTGQSSNIDYSVMSLTSASVEFIARSTYLTFLGQNKNFVSYYSASEASASTGTPDGSVSNTSVIDNNYYIVTEAPSTPGIETVYKFNVISSAIPTDVVIKGHYEGSAAHYINVEVYNYVTSTWNPLGVMQNESFDCNYSMPLLKGGSYISASQVQVRMIHPSAGVTSHNLYIDFIGLKYYPYIRLDNTLVV